MALKFGTDLKNKIINDAIVKMFAGTWGTAGTASIKIYTGAQPANADTAPSGTNSTMLCEIINIGWGSSGFGATGGTSAFSSAGGYAGTAESTGTAGWARLQTVGTGFSGSAATFVIDGEVGTASTCTFVIDSVVITATGTVTILSCPISMS